VRNWSPAAIARSLIPESRGDVTCGHSAAPAVADPLRTKAPTPSQILVLLLIPRSCHHECGKIRTLNISSERFTMRIILGNVLTLTDLQTVREMLEEIRFVDGRTTAGFAARHVKNNKQADATDTAGTAIRSLVAKRLNEHDLFRAAARPKALSPLLISRYEPGMDYGAHVDDALMNGMRTDVAFTLFLNEPAQYDGGELVIETATGEDDFKLEAGSMIVYEATTLHRVAPVTRGVRDAVVGWAQSHIRSAAERELLFDLESVRRTIYARDGKSAEFDLLSKSFSNLIRMWADA
jgi:PKHD-type hydroxylase